MASPLFLQTHVAPSFSSSSKLAQSRWVTVKNCKLHPHNSFKTLQFAGNLHYNVLQRKQSCGVIQAQESSILDSEYQTVFQQKQSCGVNVIQAQQFSISDSEYETGARRNIEDNLIGKEEELEEIKMTRVCDKLIKVFMIDKPNTSDWRKLMAFSKTWNDIKPRFFKQCRERADAENDLEMKQNLLRLARKMKEVDDDMQRHDELLNKIRENPAELDAIVAKRRKDFTGDFFEHLKTVCDSYYNDLEARDELARIGAQCLAAVEAYDNAVGDNEALRLAQVKLEDILNSPSLEAAAKKIENLAKKNQLDSSMMLLITKAWASTKESTMMKDEVKDIMYHLYMVARASLQQQVPKEVRIMKYLLTIEDPTERFTALTQAFSPGDEKQGKDVDMLYTTPKELHKWIVTVLDAYYKNKHGTLIQEARKLMKPMVIQRLDVLKGVVETDFM